MLWQRQAVLLDALLFPSCAVAPSLQAPTCLHDDTAAPLLHHTEGPAVHGDGAGGWRDAGERHSVSGKWPKPYSTFAVLHASSGLSQPVRALRLLILSACLPRSMQLARRPEAAHPGGSRLDVSATDCARAAAPSQVGGEGARSLNAAAAAAAAATVACQLIACGF